MSDKRRGNGKEVKEPSVSQKRDYQKISLVISIISLLFSSIVGLSGWYALYISSTTSSPLIEGKVWQVMQGQMADPDSPNETVAVFTTYINLVNLRKFSVDVIRYELQVDSGYGYENLTRITNIENMNLTFTSEQYKINIPNLDQNLIYFIKGPVNYGEAKHGFILFGSRNHNLDINQIKHYKLTVTDAFGKKYTTITDPSEFLKLYELNELAGIHIEPIL